MNSWRPFPMVRLVIPLLAGILSGELHSSPGLLTFFAIGLYVAGLVILLAFTLFIRGYHARMYHGIVVNLVLFAGGYATLISGKPSHESGIVETKSDGLFLISVTGTPSASGKSVSVIAKIWKRWAGNQWKSVNGMALVRMIYHGKAPAIMIGDYLLVKTSFRPMIDKSNPSSFSYTKYLNRKGVEYECFAQSYAWRCFADLKNMHIRREATFMRDHMLSVLNESGLTGREYAVAAALLLGYTGDIDAGLRKGYAATGAMHILSVSGMHVGIIYVFLEIALKWMNRKKIGKILKALVILGFLWFYALLTGLSPPVIRSAAMLSLPIIARSLNRPSGIGNVLATSLFMILAVQPGLLLDAGFQLSYLAVGGIVFLYKPIYDLYVTSRWIPDKIWSVLAVSLAAQLATLPVTLYYFHQFPNYFLLANLLVVPLSGLIIYTGIGVMIVSAIPTVAALAAKGLSAEIWLLNEIIGWIERLPGAVTQGIYVSVFFVCILYLLIASGFWFLNTRGSKVYVIMVFVCIIALMAENTMIKLNRMRLNKIVIYNFRGVAVYRFSSQNRAVFYYDRRAKTEVLETEWGRGVLSQDLDAQGISQCRYVWMSNINQTTDPASGFIPLARSGKMIRFMNYRIIIANERYPASLRNAPNADVVIVTGNPSLSIQSLVANHAPSVIIIDPTNARGKITRWRREAKETNTLIHVVQDEGPWVKEFFKTLGN